jgi:hypothetical protein
MITEKDLVFASLMGVDNVRMYQRMQLVQNEMAKKYIPRIPFLPILQEESIAQQKYGNGLNGYAEITEIPENQQFFPLSFSFTDSGQKWVFPFEPMMTISGGNEVFKVNTAKNSKDKFGNFNPGTIKTRTRQKDFTITISGLFMGATLKGKPEDCYPIEAMQKLFQYLYHHKELYVYNHLLEILGITKIVIEDYKFPFTKGENVQAYEITALSDSPYNLIVLN